MMLEPAKLAAILQEARACFLYEDAPDYLAMLEQGMQRLLSSDAGINLQTEYADLMRAAHTIKGGAGLAELHTLAQVSHQVEDLLQALLDGRVPEPKPAYQLLSLGVEEIRDLVASASMGNSAADKQGSPLPITTALEAFIDELPKENNSPDDWARPNISILKPALEFDLEECLQRVEKLLPAPYEKPRPQPNQSAILHQALSTLVDECLLLGQMLSLTWLLDVQERIRHALTQPKPPLVKIATKAIAYIRKLRLETLNPAAEKPRGRGEPNTASLTSPGKGSPTPMSSTRPQPGNTASPPNTLSLNLRIPVSRLDRMSNTVGEIMINHERLSLYQTQLYQVNLMLKKQAQLMHPIRQQVQDFYNRMATPLSGEVQVDNFNKSSLTEKEFDPLELDRYTEIHSTLQDFQELMVRVDESRTDMELISREFQEGLEELRQHVDSLRGDLTESRLVPFSFLADRFVAPLENLNQRYKKSIVLDVIGKDTLIDQVILEQLQTPLTHLMRNAFDHGIEPPEERLLLNKPPTAKITLSAAVAGNRVTIAISDDGRGIDCQKIYQKAVQMELCSLDSAALSREQILELLFTPGFSTAPSVTDVSGRGVGLDVVRSQVGRLQGKVLVTTELAKGTTFTIILPLTLSILPLLLCRCQQEILAIPSINVLEIIALSEYNIVPKKENQVITWRDRTIPLYTLIELLPYSQEETIPPSAAFTPYIGIVLDVEGEQIVVAVNSLVGERELVFKPFDPTIPVPAYVAGCTVLGTGEVVPILAPSHFNQLIAKTTPALPKSKLESEPEATSTILIVDDSIAVRRLLNQVLSQSGYQVVECRDGKEALDELNQFRHSFDLVISDIEMPRLDGFTLLREIRAHPRWYSLNCIMLTSRSNDRHRQRAMSLGATAYLTKPFQPADLLKAISTLV